MNKRTIEVKGVCAVLTARTNRSEMLYRRLLGVIVRNSPALMAVQEGTPYTPEQQFEIALMEPFLAVSARKESIIGLTFNLPTQASSDGEILQAYDDYQDDDPDLWKALLEEVDKLDKPTAPPEQLPAALLTEDQKRDVNLPQGVLSGGAPS